MYKTKDLTLKDLAKIKIKNQAEIVQYIGSELDPKEAHEQIKNASKNFTIPNAKAEQADALLYAIYSGEAVTTTHSNAKQMEWQYLSKQEALEKFKEGVNVYAIGEDDLKVPVESEGIISLTNRFAIQVEKTKPQKTKKENTKAQPLTNAQIKILKIKKEKEIALIAIRLKRKKRNRQSA